MGTVRVRIRQSSTGRYTIEVKRGWGPWQHFIEVYASSMDQAEKIAREYLKVREFTLNERGE